MFRDIEEPLAQFPLQPIRHGNASQSRHQRAGGYCARSEPGVSMQCRRKQAGTSPPRTPHNQRSVHLQTRMNQILQTRLPTLTLTSPKQLDETEHKCPYDRVLQGLENVIVREQIVLEMGVEKSPIVKCQLHRYSWLVHYKFHQRPLAKRIY